MRRRVRNNAEFAENAESAEKRRVQTGFREE
jgi:hypothetical protein